MVTTSNYRKLIRSLRRLDAETQAALTAAKRCAKENDELYVVYNYLGSIRYHALSEPMWGQPKRRILVYASGRTTTQELPQEKEPSSAHEEAKD